MAFRCSRFVFRRNHLTACCGHRMGRVTWTHQKNGEPMLVNNRSLNQACPGFASLGRAAAGAPARERRPSCLSTWRLDCEGFWSAVAYIVAKGSNKRQ